MTNPPTVETREASLLLVAASPFLIKTTQTLPWPHLAQPLSVLLTSLGIAHAQLCDLTPARQIFATNAVFVKIAQLNGMIAQCIIQPLVPKRQRILIPCANPPNSPNLNHPCAVLLHHHVVTAPITCRTTWTNLVIPNVVDHTAALAVVLAAAPLVDHPAVIVRTMIKPVVNPLGPVMTTMLVTMTSLMIHQPSNMIVT